MTHDPNQPPPHSTLPQPPISGPPGYPHQPPQYVVVQRPPTSASAVGSLVFGILGVLGGWCIFGIPCLIAVILGHLALRETRNDQMGGHGMAVTGVILGYLFVAPALLWTVFGAGASLFR